MLALIVAAFYKPIHVGRRYFVSADKSASAFICAVNTVTGLWLLNKHGKFDANNNNNTNNCKAHIVSMTASELNLRQKTRVMDITNLCWDISSKVRKT